MLARFQRGLEHLYRIDTKVCVDDFLIDESARDQIGVSRRPREQLLLHEDEEGLDVGLFVDERTIGNLVRNDPSNYLGDHNLQDFLHVVEGVSHFVYVIWRAGAGRSVSPLELELQAEIDKFISCILMTSADVDFGRVRQRLFFEFEYESDLDVHERDRYRAANENAIRYSERLERRYLRVGRLNDMLAELRRFYRMSLGTKLDFIRSA